MALIERDGKVYARKLWISLGPSEWGNDLMRQVAREAFATDASLDAVQVNEHAGWYLTFLRDGTVVGTANDQAHLDETDPERLDTDVREGDLGTEPSNTSDSGFFEMTPTAHRTDNPNSGD